MQNLQKTGRKPQKIGVLLFDRFSNHCLANAIEPLRAANSLLGRDAYEWEFLSLDGNGVTSSSGLPVAVVAALSDAPTGAGPGDYLFVMPSYQYRDFVTPVNLRALRAAATRFSTLVAMDAGSWLLASAGLMTGRRVTIHWEELDSFQEAFPELNIRRSRLEIDGDRWSCGGAMTAFDLALRMIGDRFGEALRLEVAALLMSGETDAGLPGSRPKSRIVSAALVLMREHLEDPISIVQLAGALGVSARRLENLFRTDLGAGPQKVYRRLRLLAARRYVEHTGLSVAEIAVRSGYSDPSAMTRAFRAEFGVSPRNLRADTPGNSPGAVFFD